MRCYISATLLMSAVTLSRVATAADDAQLAEAKARFEEGLKLSDAGQYEAARLKYLQALNMKSGSSGILYNLAVTEAKMGRDVDAIEHLRESLKQAPSNPQFGDADVANARKRIAELLTKVGQIEVEARDDVRLTVDGRALTVFPKETVPVTAGQHTVTATFDSKVKTVTVTPGAGQTVKAVFDFGSDDKAQATAQPSEKAKEGAEERSTLGWVVPIGLGVVGLGGIVMGAGFASAAKGTKDELGRVGTPGLCAQPPNSACAAYDDKISTMNSQRTLSWVGYGVGGAALAAAVVTFVVWPKSRKATPKTGGMALAPMLDPHHAGANLELKF